jgi:hypothetical protein
MVKHPKQLGFKLGLKIFIGEPATITEETPDASTVTDVVYVALLAENSGSLKKRDALKIGQTGGTLKKRWQGIVGLFRRDNLRPSERLYRKRFLKVANRKEVFVWMREAGKIEIPYANGLRPSVFSSRGAEEEFLDEYYEPKLGTPLNMRQPRKPIKISDPN